MRRVTSSVSLESLRRHIPSRLAGLKVPPKYRDPANPTNVWSGRGRSPRWFAEALRAGLAAEAMLIRDAHEEPSDPEGGPDGVVGPDGR